MWLAPSGLSPLEFYLEYGYLVIVNTWPVINIPHCIAVKVILRIFLRVLLYANSQ